MDVGLPRRHWSGLTGVERVGLYTRQSLYLLLWAINAFTLVSVALGIDDRAEAIALVAGGAVVTAFGFAAVASVLRRFPEVDPPGWRGRAPLLAVSAAYLALAAAWWVEDARTAAASVVVVSLTLAFGLLPGRGMLLALLALSGLLFALAGRDVVDAVPGLLVATVFLFTARASMWMFTIVTDLDTARQAQAQLAVAEERLRFSRDVHDVLGRRLSTIAVQAELAATLAARGDQRAAERMLEVRGVAHEALREAREMARGYRAVDVLHELDGARSLLRSAGVELRQRVDDLPRAWHEPAAWVVRESITNVLRHSAAGMVEIAYADGELRVENDHAHPGGAADGSGLRGLRERLEPLGATLSAGPADPDRWVVVARLPGAGPVGGSERRGVPA